MSQEFNRDIERSILHCCFTGFPGDIFRIDQLDANYSVAGWKIDSALHDDHIDSAGKSVLWKLAAFSPGNNGWGTVARLKPGISWLQARDALAVEAERLSSKAGGIDYSTLHPSMTSLPQALAGPVKNASLMFMGAVVLVLLIARTNVANLSMAHTADRRAELHIRSALGAIALGQRDRLLTECWLLSFVATCDRIGDRILDDLARGED